MMKKIHVIQHTHWDFEWYFTRNEAMVQFVYHMDEVFRALENQAVDYYLLDGQMSILDDYLDAYPEQKEEVIKWVKAKRLLIGPWYTQTDELIVSGEAIVRNLDLGINLANELGGSQKIGYLPDSFGQGVDMPKIYNGMGIKHAVFWRGLPKEKTSNREFNWQAEDGSKVIVVNIKDGYFVGGELIYNDDIHDLMSRTLDGVTLKDAVLPVGGDQRYVDFNLKEKINKCNPDLKKDGIELVESTYSKYFEQVDKSKGNLDTVSGEFIDSTVSKIHRSIYSSRYDQKYLSDKVERRLIYQLEPLMAMAGRIGISYKKSLLDKIWKLIVRNQAHDSAGGCNSDKTNEIILERLREADQLSYSTVDYLTRKISESEVDKKDNNLTFFNLLPYPVTKNVKFEISLKEKNFELFDNDVKVSMDIWDIEKKYHGQIKRDESSYEEKNFYYTFHCSATVTLPALQWKTFKIKPTVEMEEVAKACESKSIENGHFKIEFEDGLLNLINKQEQNTISDFIRIVDDGDEGDTYDYSPAHFNQVFNLDLGDAEVICKCGKTLSELKLVGSWNLPKNLQERKDKEFNGIVNYELTIQLGNQSNLIQVHLLLGNQIEDHRMRVVVRTDLKQNKYSYADTAFGYIKRSVVDKNLFNWKEKGLKEEPTAIFPMLHYTNIHDEKSSISVLTKGIKEYQIVGDEFNEIALTLFRSVGYLGRPDLLRRPGVASGNQFTYIPTPNSQLKERLHFKFAISLDNQFSPAQIMRDFQKYAISNPFYQQQELNQFTNTLKYFVIHPLPKLIEPKPFFIFNNQDLIFSSLTESSDEAGWLIRIYNPNKKICSGSNVIELTDAKMISLTDFTGKILNSLGQLKKVSLDDFQPGEIRTIKINK